MKNWKVVVGMATTFVIGVMTAVGFLNDGMTLKANAEQSTKIATVEISTIYFGVDSWPVNLKKLTPELEGKFVTDINGNEISEVVMPAMLLRLKAKNEKNENVSFGNIRICEVDSKLGCSFFMQHLIENVKYNPQKEMNTVVNLSAQSQDFFKLVFIGQDISHYKGRQIKLAWQDQENTYHESQAVSVPRQANGQINFQL